MKCINTYMNQCSICFQVHYSSMKFIRLYPYKEMSLSDLKRFGSVLICLSSVSELDGFDGSYRITFHLYTPDNPLISDSFSGMLCCGVSIGPFCKLKSMLVFLYFHGCWNYTHHDHISSACIHTHTQSPLSSSAH